MPGKHGPIADRFWAKVDKGPNHWFWTGYVNPNGYGYFQPTPLINPQPAQRVAWTLTGRTIPAGQILINECGARDCVHPAHWSLSTYADMRRRAWAAKKGTVTS